MSTGVVHKNLDTAYVNLAALLRYLQRLDFIGRVHVELIEYEADVFLNSQEQPRVRERDHASGRVAEGEDALQRLMVRATEAGGLISVYEGEAEAADEGPEAVPEIDGEGSAGDAALSPEEQDWQELLRLSGELVAAVERAALSARIEFEPLFREARIESADDFPFLDPMSRRLEYSSGGHIRLHTKMKSESYVSGLCECLHRVVAKLATGARGDWIRERIALELAVLARRRQTPLMRFKLGQQFERIAGMRVI